MLLIGYAKINQLRALIENYKEDGAKFQVIKHEGLNVTVTHNLESDAMAKALVKKLVHSDPSLKAFYLSVKIIDENGNLV